MTLVIHEQDFLTASRDAGNGGFDKFNTCYFALTGDTLSLRTYQRRRKLWITDADEAVCDKPLASGIIPSPVRTRESLRGNRFVFTSAQNNTFVHAGFMENLLSYCEHNNAQLVIGRFSYNRNGYHRTKGDSSLWYDPAIQPYVLDVSADLQAARNGLVWCGELDILPTASNPLSGLDSYSRASSSIVPHAKLQLKSVAVMKDRPNKFLYSTGAVTQGNYIDRKAGQKAAFHHVYGALVVDIAEDGQEFCRQIIADESGMFYDLTTQYKQGEVHTDISVRAINWGDIHAEKIDKQVMLKGWIEQDSMLDVLKPRAQFIHDLTDFAARNHHNRGDPHFLAKMFFEDTSSVEEGLNVAAEVLALMERDGCSTIVVESNHDQAFQKWLAEAEIKRDPENAEYFHTANAEIFKNIRHGAYFNVFEWALRRHKRLDTVEFLKEDDSYIICDRRDGNGVECGMHGHRGTNGARGSANSFRHIGSRCNVGHAHSPAIIDGVYVAGVSASLDLGYNKGPSSWSHSHIVTYENGKRAIVTMKNGRWRV